MIPNKLTKKQIKIRRIFYFSLFFTPVIFPFVPYHLINDQELVGSIVTIVFCLGLLVVFFSVHSFYYYGWMDIEDCDELHCLCVQHKELNEYRLAVIEEGREFTREEFEMMRAYPSRKDFRREQESRASRLEFARKQLYSADK